MMRKDYALALNNDYSTFAAVTILSVIESSHKDDDLYFHILSGDISDENKNLLKGLGQGKRSVKYNFYNPTNQMDESMIVNSLWGREAWFRVFLPGLLDSQIRRVLYLDCDVIVRCPLDELFEMDMDGHPIAAVEDIQSKNNETYSRLGYAPEYKYICSGVLLMNLDEWRKRRITGKIIEKALKNKEKVIFPDQDVINMACVDDKIVLSPEYGVLTRYFLEPNFLEDYGKDTILDLLDHPKIIHYAGYQPWIYAKNKSAHSWIWWDFYKRLPKGVKNVEKTYYISIIKFFVRYILTIIGLIGKDSPYSIYKYYYHDKITRASVMKSLDMVKY